MHTIRYILLVIFKMHIVIVLTINYSVYGMEVTESGQRIVASLRSMAAYQCAKSIQLKETLGLQPKKIAKENISELCIRDILQMLILVSDDSKAFAQSIQKHLEDTDLSDEDYLDVKAHPFLSPLPIAILSVRDKKQLAYDRYINGHHYKIVNLLDECGGSAALNLSNLYINMIKLPYVRLTKRPECVTTLDVSGNRLKELNENVVFSSAWQLNLADNQFEKMPSLQDFTNLTQLNLSQNPIAMSTADITVLQLLQNLIRLDISSAQFTEQPHLEELTQLEN